MEIPFEQAAGAVIALVTSLGSVVAFLYKKLSDRTENAISLLTKELTDCNQKHADASQELNEISKRHANLEGRIQAMEMFNPAGLVNSITQAMANLLDSRKL
jgi:F0F1-type ATP synthase membrane subunit b/b'